MKKRGGFRKVKSLHQFSGPDARSSKGYVALLSCGHAVDAVGSREFGSRLCHICKRAEVAEEKAAKKTQPPPPEPRALKADEVILTRAELERIVSEASARAAESALDRLTRPNPPVESTEPEPTPN